MSRPREQISLTETDHQTLQAWLRASNTSQSLVQRAKLILLTAEGQTALEVAQAVGCNQQSVYKWRRRFKTQGIAGLHDRPRPGQPRRISAAQAKEVLRLTVERIPAQATHWSLRLMAKTSGLTVWQVRRIWQAADLRPHRLKTFKISQDPHFAEKVIDVVGLYLNPPDNAVVLSVDEKTQIQALDRTQPLLPLRPGQIERRTHDYTRNGTTSLYAAFDIATSQVIGCTTQRHRAQEFLDFLRQIDRQTPEEIDLHLILDNSSTHKTAKVNQWLAKHPRFKLHFTPTSASWLNAVEGWFSQLERRALHRGTFNSVQALRDEIHRYIKVHNAGGAKPFKWTKTAETILQAVDRAKNIINTD